MPFKASSCQETIRERKRERPMKTSEMEYGGAHVEEEED
jgi:hypothetical protein